MPTAVVSMPCFALFDAQAPSYHDAVLGTAPRVAIEAASSSGWAAYVAGVPGHLRRNGAEPLFVYIWSQSV